MSLFKPVLFALSFLMSVSGYAQEGYPLNGTWRGQWAQGDEVMTAVVVMDWDGTSINGRINPGRYMVRFDKASLDASSWTVHIEATSKEGQPIVIDGVLGDVGSYNRTLTGTWSLAGGSSPIVLTRE